MYVGAPPQRHMVVPLVGRGLAAPSPDRWDGTPPAFLQIPRSSCVYGGIPSLGQLHPKTLSYAPGFLICDWRLAEPLPRGNGEKTRRRGRSRPTQQDTNKWAEYHLLYTTSHPHHPHHTAPHHRGAGQDTIPLGGGRPTNLQITPSPPGV